MRQFIQRHRDQILGVLSGFDRLRLRGTLRLLTSVGGMMSYLSLAGMLIKDFMGYAEDLTRRLRQTTEENAQAAGRPVCYLPGATRKDELIEKIRREEGLAADGLIAVLSTLENCHSYDIYRNRSAKQVQLRQRSRKCLHYYFYFLDDTFGLTQVRLQTWFPFNVHVVLNGREWLAQRLDAASIGYRRQDNCFVDIEDFVRAQQLADQQPRIAWPKHLKRLLDRVHPLHQQLFDECPGPYYWTSEGPYYWTSEQNEWATSRLWDRFSNLSFDRLESRSHRGPRRAVPHADPPWPRDVSKPGRDAFSGAQSPGPRRGERPLRRSGGYRSLASA